MGLQPVLRMASSTWSLRKRLGFGTTPSARGIGEAGYAWAGCWRCSAFVGFERATGARAEAHKPLKTIVIQSPMMAGVFFIVCSYAEVMGFHTIGQDLGNNQAPTCVLAIGRRRAAAGVVDR